MRLDTLEQSEVAAARDLVNGELAELFASLIFRNTDRSHIKTGLADAIAMLADAKARLQRVRAAFISRTA